MLTAPSVDVGLAREVLLDRLCALLPGNGKLSVKVIVKEESVLFRCRRDTRMGMVDVEVPLGDEHEVAEWVLQELALTPLEPIS